MTPDLDINDQIGHGRIIILTPPLNANLDNLWALVTNTIYMISSTNFPSISSAVEDPPDLPWHHLRDDRYICNTTFGSTPFHLNHNMESVLPIKDQIPSPRLANDLRLEKGAYLFVDSDRQLLENPHNGLYLKKFYA